MVRSKLRVLSVVTNLTMGGDESRLLNFARAVDRDRFEHIVLALTQPEHAELCPFGLMKPHFDRHHIPVMHLDEEPRIARRRKQTGLSLLWEDSKSFCRVMNQLTRFIRDHGIDVVDARPNYATLFGLLAGRTAGVAAVVTTSYGWDEMWATPVRYAIGQTMLSQVDAVISDSQYAINELQRWLLRKHPRTTVIPNGIFCPVPEKSRRDVRRFFDLPTDPKLTVVGQVSRLVPYKGHNVLLDAAHYVLQQEPGIAFLFCGYASDQRYVDQLRSRADRLGIGSRIRIGGYPGPSADVFGAIDIHVHASLRDSSPIAIHESMALGLPAVVTNVGGITDLVEDGYTALMVPPDNVQALTQALLRIIRNPEFAKSLGQRARQRFDGQFQAPKMARALEQLFSRLVTERN